MNPEVSTITASTARFSTCRSNSPFSAVNTTPAAATAPSQSSPHVVVSSKNRRTNRVNRRPEATNGASSAARNARQQGQLNAGSDNASRSGSPTASTASTPAVARLLAQSWTRRPSRWAANASGVNSTPPRNSRKNQT